MVTCIHHKFVFRHMVELPHCECVFCSTQEEESGRVRLFLVFRDRRKIYMRCGIRGNWEEVLDQEEYEAVWEGFEQAILERKIPSFVASAMSFAGV